jgi:WD40 repeat protein
MMEANRTEFPAAFADLLAGENLPEHVWADADREAVFRHQMGAPVRLELGALEPSRQALVRNLLDADPSLLASLRGLLERRDAPIEVLMLVKAFARSMAVHPDATLPQDVAAAIYALTILAARRDGHPLTRLSDDQLRSMAQWVRTQPWIDDSARRLVEQGVGEVDAAPSVELSLFAEREWLESRLVDPPLQIGSVASVDGYDVLRVIAEGGMALVMLARSPDDGSPVAIKVMKPSLLDSPRLVQRFVDEARHMAQLDHPNILKVIEWSARRSGPYYVMPYVARGSLAELLRAGAIDATTACTILSQVAEALSVAHLRGITHRDVKPSNILLGDDGRALVSDFGLARTVFNDATLDASAAVLEGSAPYVSPGVASGQAEDTRCDIYGLGATLYEMLTGRAPYSGPNAAEVLAQVRAGPPVPVLSVNPRASKALAKVCETCMARDLRDRYATMADVCADLLEIQAGARPLGRRTPHRRRWPIAAGLAAGAALLAWAFWPDRTPPEVGPRFVSTGWSAPLARQLQPTMVATRMFAEGRGDTAIRFASDSRTLVCRSGSWEAGSIEQLDARTLAPVRTISGRGGLFDVASASQRAVVDSEVGPRVIDLDTGQVIQQFAPTANTSFMAISHDGSRICVNGTSPDGSNRMSLRVHEVDSGALLLELPIEGSAGTAAAFVDNGGLLVWNLGAPGLKLLDVAQGDVKATIDSHALWGPLIRRSPDGRRVVTAGVDLTVQLFDADSLAPLGRRLGWTSDPTGLALLDDGRLVASDASGLTLAFDADGSELWRYQHIRPTPTTDVSPDGSSLAVMSIEGQLWIYAMPSTGDVVESTPLSLPPPAPGEVVRASLSSMPASAVTVAADGRTVFVGTVDGELAALDTSDGTLRWRRPVVQSTIRQVVSDGPETLVVSTHADGVRRVRTSDGSEVATIDAASTSQVVAPVGDGSVIVVDGSRFRRIGSTDAWERPQSNFTLDADVSADGSLAVFGTNRFAAVVREVKTGEIQARLIGHDGFVSSVRFLRDPTRVLSGASDGRVMLWHWPSGSVVHQFDVGGAITAVVPMPDDRLMVSVGAEFMKLWDLAAGQLVRTYPASRGIRDAASSPDGRFIWTVGPGPLVRKWAVPELPKLD